ncbi:hypothetical protein TL16_g05749 [Triparma laevis f. inornata]|uniref:Uncharacterized protein n=1 Tax=Triparma laevis f. inornata TaxID=1714386 RepID=A0A9W7ED04_9STRA|nr:hypothetical protein TL16_g05749 [Triparma laevis f. inornata]
MLSRPAADLFPMSNFLETNDFRRLLLPFVPLDTLVNMRDLNKEWRIETDFYLKAAEASGTTIVHSGRDKSCVGYDGGLLDLLDGWSEACLAKMVERSSVCTVIFHPNVTKIGSLSFGFAVNLVCVEVSGATTRH